MIASQRELAARARAAATIRCSVEAFRVARHERHRRRRRPMRRRSSTMARSARPRRFRRSVDTVAGHRRETWSDSQGRTIIERYDIRGMGHGTPLDTRGAEACGTSGPHMLEAGICSTRQIASSWGLIGASVRRDAPPVTAVQTPPEPAFVPPAPGGVGAVIEDALRAAGLMR